LKPWRLDVAGLPEAGLLIAPHASGLWEAGYIGI